MFIIFIIIITCLGITPSFINKNIRKPIPVPENAKRVLGKMRGFFGTIGPDIEMSKTDSLFNLFLGNGIIHGLFFDNGKLTFVRHLIQTEKVIRGSRPIKTPMQLLAEMGLHKAGLAPNPMGVANTAILHSSSGTYAMFERDLPHQIDVDFENYSVNTLGKFEVKNVPYLSGHSKFDNNLIKSLDYNVMENLAHYREFDPPFSLKSSKTFTTKYLPIIHDFISTEKGSVIFADCPFDMSKTLDKGFPVFFDNSKPTFFHVVKNGVRTLLDTNQSFYIFHYGSAKENRTHVEFYAPIYENMDFSKIDIRGKYRRITLDIRSGLTRIEGNSALDQYNLDFPIICGNYTILRNLDLAKKRIDGFVLCDGLEIRDTLFFDDRNFCGEPSLIRDVDGENYLVSFAYCGTSNNSFCILIRILESGDLDKEYIEIPMGEDVGIVFHSTFILPPNS